MRTKSKPNGYQFAMFATPVASSNPAEATSSATIPRSIAWAGAATGGHANSRGITDHSFTISTGIAASPRLTWSPCVTAYSHAGPAGQPMSSGRSSRTIALAGRPGS